MTSVIFFRFKNAISQDQVLFDGSVIQIGDVKRLIAIKRGLGAEGAAELTLFDSSTNEEYTDDGKVIPRNSLVIVKRAPVTKFKPLQSAAPVAAQAPAPVATDLGGAVAGTQPAGGADAAVAAPPADEFGGDYYSEKPQRAVVGEDEEKALQSLLQGTAANWSSEVRRGAMRGRGRGRGGRGAAPLDYRCSRCDAVGQHWVQDCPTQGDPNFDRKRIRPPVGIPMTRLAKSEEGGLILPDGQTGTLVANEDAFAREILGLPTAAVAQPAPTAVPAAETKANGSAAGPAQQVQQQQQQQQVNGEEGPAVLLLDNKAHEVKAEQGGSNPKAPGQAALPSGGSQIALPQLAGDEELASPAVAMPGAAFFNMFMQSVLLPRGPPDFIVKAFNRDEPLPRSEFEQERDEYRRRYQMPPLPGPRVYSPGRDRRIHSKSPQPARSGKEGVDAGRRSRGPEPRGVKEERSRRSRSRSRERRRSRERGDPRRRGSPQRSSRTEDKRRSDNKEASRSERSRRGERNSEERARKRGRSRERSSEREHRRRHRRSRDEEAAGVERWQPSEELVAPLSSAGTPAASQQAQHEEAPAAGAARHGAVQRGSPVAAPADVDVRRQPRSPSQPAVSSGAEGKQPAAVQQWNGPAAPGSDVQVSGGAAAEPLPGPATEAAPPNQEEQQDGDRHRKRHKKEKKEKKEKREKKEKKEKKEKRKHRHRSRSGERFSEGGTGTAARQEGEDVRAERERRRRMEEEAAQRAEQERRRREEEEQRAQQEAAERAKQEAAEREQRRAQRRAEREAALGPPPSRDKKLGPRLFDRAVVAAMRDKRGSGEEGGAPGEVEEGRERSSRHSKHLKRR